MAPMELSLVVAAVTLVAAVQGAVDTWQLRMPGVVVEQKDTYLCHAGTIDPEQDFSIVEFLPKSTMQIAHHILIYGCSEPGSYDDIWECGEMHKADVAQAPPCSTGSQIVYAWAKDAPALQLPEGVGFKVGGQSGINYLVLQVHYATEITEPDNSGVDLHVTTDILPKSAGVYLLATSGGIRSQTTEHFEAACQIDEDIVIHPFAFRTHTHKLGKVVSGYKVSPEGKWTLVGKKNPMLPQMFYPVDDTDVTITKGDVVAARCTMYNHRDHVVKIGATDEDEMCNFYMMYWVDGDRTAQENRCLSFGPPNFYWADLGDRLADPPKDASEPEADDAEHMADMHH